MIAIRWSGKASDQLAAIWMAANSVDRRDINDSLEGLEVALSRRPRFVGEGMPSGLRRTVAGPLGLEFHVREADGFVHVIRVWRIRRPS